jgi:hypothetical protein
MPTTPKGCLGRRHARIGQFVERRADPLDAVDAELEDDVELADLLGHLLRRDVVDGRR